MLLISPSLSFAFFTFVLFPFVLETAYGFSPKSILDSPLAQKIAANRSITVDVNGKGDFDSVQAAVDSVPEGNSDWIIIHVRKGVYREKVYIPQNKPYIFLRGRGKGKTALVWSQISHDSFESATFRVEAPHFVAFGISFKNEAPYWNSNPSWNQSVAAIVSGDKASFYHCAFYSSHNTLFDCKGRHYYDNCYIQGSIDFIFGQGQSIFENCEIFVMGNRRAEIHGSITAHHGESGDEKSGFVFLKGKVYGVGEVYLGRAKGAHSRVIFANSYLSKTIVPQGWTNWSYSGGTENLFHAEYASHGPGSDQTSRASWSKQLEHKEAAHYLSLDFINGKEWLPSFI